MHKYCWRFDPLWTKNRAKQYKYGTRISSGEYKTEQHTFKGEGFRIQLKVIDFSVVPEEKRKKMISGGHLQPYLFIVSRLSDGYEKNVNFWKAGERLYWGGVFDLAWEEVKNAMGKPGIKLPKKFNPYVEFPLLKYQVGFNEFFNIGGSKINDG
jgi:hypothetical protein